MLEKRGSQRAVCTDAASKGKSHKPCCCTRRENEAKENTRREASNRSLKNSEWRDLVQVLLPENWSCSFLPVQTPGGLRSKEPQCCTNALTLAASISGTIQRPCLKALKSWPYFDHTAKTQIANPTPAMILKDSGAMYGGEIGVFRLPGRI